MRWLPAAAIVLGSGVVAAQFVRLPRTNPRVDSELVAPVEVARILRRACYDCHSNETGWPWYSDIAPFSWLIRHDVVEGRRRLNFSQWGDYAYDPGTVCQKLEKISQLVASSDMAPWYYQLLRPHARLTPAEREALIAWVRLETSVNTFPADCVERTRP